VKYGRKMKNASTNTPMRRIKESLKGYEPKLIAFIEGNQYTEDVIEKFLMNRINEAHSPATTEPESSHN